MTKYLVLSPFTTNSILHHNIKTELCTAQLCICHCETVYCQQNVKQLTDFIVGAVYWLAEWETANRRYCWCCLLVSQDGKQPTYFTVWAVTRTAECETANRLYCWCCLLDSRMSNSQQTIVGAVSWTAECERANRLYCWCCLLDSRM